MATCTLQSSLPSAFLANTVPSVCIFPKVGTVTTPRPSTCNFDTFHRLVTHAAGPVNLLWWKSVSSGPGCWGRGKGSHSTSVCHLGKFEDAAVAEKNSDELGLWSWGTFPTHRAVALSETWKSSTPLQEKRPEDHVLTSTMVVSGSNGLFGFTSV